MVRTTAPKAVLGTAAGSSLVVGLRKQVVAGSVGSSAAPIRLALVSSLATEQLEVTQQLESPPQPVSPSTE